MLKPDSEISRQARWQRKHRAMGLCVLCSEPVFKGWRCEKHYEQHKITMRLRYIPKVRGRYNVGGKSTSATGDKPPDKPTAKNKKKRSAKVARPASSTKSKSRSTNPRPAATNPTTSKKSATANRKSPPPGKKATTKSKTSTRQRSAEPQKTKKVSRR